MRLLLNELDSVSEVSRNRGKDVLLVFPGNFKAANPQIPLSMLYVANPLMRRGYAVRVLDMRLENYRNFRLGDPFFVGISSMSGVQIRYGLEFARKVRAEEPSCPIVWGGVHPTLLPEQTVASEYVDIAVRGEGEPVIGELADRLSAGESLEGLNGVTYKSEGKIRSNPDAPMAELDDIPVDLPYDLLSMDKYPAVKAGRFHIQTSRGCPHACGFCYNSVFNKRKWRGKNPKRVLDEIEYILKKFPNTKWIDPIDDNFFVDQKRVEAICEGMIKRGFDVSWRANCRFDYLSQYSKDFIELLAKSGCVELDFGGETGSSRLLSFMEKQITPDQMLHSVENLGKWGPTIEPYVSWMTGLPSETEDDLKETFNLMDKMTETNEKTQHFGIFVYTPFPSPIVDTLEPNFKPPQTLEAWADIEVFHFKPPWHPKKYVDKLQAISAVTKYAFYPEARLKERGTLYRLGYGILNRTAKFRWKHRYFGAPIELKLINSAARKFRGYV